jgi:hypothetical protein
MGRDSSISIDSPSKKAAWAALGKKGNGRKGDGRKREGRPEAGDGRPEAGKVNA